MSDDPVNLPTAAATLAHQFDDSFAHPIREARTGLIPLLVVTAGDSPHALLLSNLCHFAMSTTIIPLPHQRPSCLGLAAYRGKPIAVYSLDRMLGFPKYDPTPRWLAVTHGQVAIGIHALIGQIHAHPDDMRQTDSTRIVLVNSEPCPLIDLDTLISDHLTPVPAGRFNPKE